DARTREQKIDAARTLCDNAAKAGDAALAAELRGQSLLDQGQAEPAALAFAQAVKAGDRSPELYLNFATALHSLKDDKGAESLLWKVISERPLYRDAYVELYAL